MTLKQQHFYYGAILSAIIENNPDASVAMLQRNDEHRGIFTIETNTSQKCCIFFKQALQKKKETKVWQFLFSDDDVDILKIYYNEKIPTFIYLLCRTSELKNSEIAVLKLDEFLNLNKESITIKPNHHNFDISRGKSPSNDFSIARNRITKDFDTLITEVVKDSNGYYCPRCNIPIDIEQLIQRHCCCQH